MWDTPAQSFVVKSVAVVWANEKPLQRMVRIAKEIFLIRGGFIDLLL